MQFYTNNITNPAGTALAGLSVRVQNQDGSTATIYSDNGITPATNPLTTDGTGSFGFYAANGRYQLAISGNGITPYTVKDILLNDPTQVFTNDIDMANLANTANGKGADLIANAAKKVANITALKALRAPTGSDALTVIVDCYSVAGDGGGGIFYADLTDTTSTDNGGTIIVSSAGTRWKRHSFGQPLNIRWFGAKADANYQSGGNSYVDSAHTIPATDNLPALTSALNALKNAQTAYPLTLAGRLTVPVGNFFFSNTIELHHTVILTGENIGQAGTPATIFHFPPNTTGLIVQRGNTTGLTGTLAQGIDQADGSEIANIAFIGDTSGTTGHGVALRARANIHDCQISYFSQDGLHIVADSGGVTDPLGNANNWRASNLRINNNGGNGVYVKGADTNAGYGELIDASNNGGWGISDNCFLGNTWDACHAAGNTSGPYQTTNNNAHSVFEGCYSESGQPPSSLAYPSFAIGGLHAAGVIGIYIDGTLGRLRVTAGVESYLGTGTGNNAITARIGGDGHNGDMLYFSETANCPNGWRLKQAGADLIWNYNNSWGLMAITGPNTTYQFGRGAAQPFQFLFENNLFVGTDNNARLITYGSAAPTTGTYGRGDCVFNNAPSASGSMGWQCVTAGTPGVWKAMPNLSA